MLFQSVLFRGLLWVIAGVGVLVLPAFGATIDVDESAPGVGAVIVDTTDGLCSLREAITNANANNQSGSAECTAGSGTDTIVLPSNATFTLSDAAVINGGTCGSVSCGNAGLPFITSPIIIKGNGSTIERDSSLVCSLNGTATNDEFRILMVRSGSLVLEGTTVKNGCADGDWDFGGGIDNLGSLTIRNSTLSGNQAGPGGAIHASGSTLIESSTLSGNSAQFGGAVWASISSFTIRNSTLSGNSASAWGGAVYQSTATATLVNVTVADNTAPTASGIFNNNGTVNARNVIFSGSVCANGSSPGTWNPSGSNFDSATSCATLFGSNFTSNATLNLGALADNGGTTQTRAMGAGSAAIDAVALADCSQATDQRGVARPQGTLCDAGSFEVLVALSSPATINVDESSAGVGAVVVDPHDGLCSIREAIANANDSSTGMVHPDCEQGYPGGADTIVLPSSATFTLPDAVQVNANGDTGLPYIRSEITIQGNGSRLERDSTLPCNINGSKTAGEFRVLAVLSTGHLILEDASVTNSCVDPSPGNGAGGGIWNQGRLTLRRVEVANHAVYSLGGGINSDSSLPVLIEDSLIAGNSVASGGGGGLFARTGMTIRNSTISGNSATSSGGAMVLVLQGAGIHTLENVTFSENTAPSASGIDLSSGTIRAQNIVMQDATCQGSSSGYVASGVNFDSGTSCSGLFGSNFTSNAVLNLGPLADNGGPTRTHALGTGSAAIDAVPDGQCTPYGGGAAFTIDQRGETRPLDGNGDGTALCDAGAFEVAGLTIDDVTVTEDPTTATFTISRGTATVGTSTVQTDTADGTATAGADYTAIVAQTVTIPDGTSSATIVVPILEDLIDEGAGENYFVNLTSSSNAAVADAQGVGTITDDDTAMIAISDATVTEGDAGTVDATFTVSLSNQASSNVTVDYATADDTASAGLDYTAIPTTTLTFTPGETLKSVTVAVLGEMVDEANETFFVNLSNGSHTIADGQGLGTITDDDTAGVTLSKVAVATSETGTTDSFTAVLDAEPTAEVTLTITSGDPTEGLLSDADETDQSSVTVTFTPANWSVAQTVTVTGQDDVLIDGSQNYNITTTTASGDLLWNGLTVATVSATNNDDDTPGVDVTPVSGLVTTEAGGTATFDVVLNAQPAADVLIDFGSNDATEGLVSTDGVTEQSTVTVTFTPTNWDVPQTVTVHGQDDLVTDGNQGYSVTSSAASSADATWNGIAVGDVAVTNEDDEVSSITVTPTSGLVTTEGGATDTFTIVLTSEPTADVEIGLSSSDSAEGSVSPTSVTFTNGNWNVAQTVTVTGVDDDVDDGDQTWNAVTADAISTDPTYGGAAAADPSVLNVDDDTRGVTATPTGGLVTTEAGGTDSFTIVLDSEPLADVTIGLSSSDPTEGMVSPPNVTFTNGNWNVPQTVTVTGQDDALTDGNQTYNVTTMTASGDLLWQGLVVASVAVTNNDDDTPGVDVTPTSGLVTTEGGGTATFDVVLNAQPAADASIDFSSNDTTEGLVSSDGVTEQSTVTVTFTPANWDVTQTVTVHGQDDLVTDGDQGYSVTSSAVSSADATWNGVAVGDVAVTNEDDEVSSITVTPTSGLVTTEGGATDTFTIVLTSEPMADVVIGLSSSSTTEGIVAPSSVTFTSANWNVAQTVTVTGVDDNLADGDQPYTIVTEPAVSGDPSYDGTAVADVAATNLDDETSAGDSDGDGVPDTVEDGAPNGGDGNDDGVQDSVQPSIASLPAANGNGYLTVMSTCQLREVQARLRDDFDPVSFLFPYALVEFRLPCTSTAMTILYHEGDGWGSETYLKYGPETPGQELTTKWYQLPGVVFDTTTVAGSTVARASFTLSDGEIGDDTGVDGEIVDQGGPGTPIVAAIPTTSEWMLLLMAMTLGITGAWKLR